MHKAAEEVANIPIPVYVFLFITILLAMILFFQATRSRLFLTLSLVWIIIQAIIGTTGIYHNATMVPPPLLLFGMLPMILFIVWILSSSMGKQWIARCDLQWLTFFHAIRILVEGVLLLLYQSGSMSKWITFEGSNFDILSGLTAPIVAYFAFRHGTVHRTLLVVWNILALLLLLNVVITAVFCIPSPIQQFAFDQPNRAVQYFPFHYIPVFLVPLVFLAHGMALKRLFRMEK